MEVPEVDFWPDIHQKYEKVSERFKSFGSKKEQLRIMEGIKGYSLWDSDEIENLENKVFSMVERGAKARFTYVGYDYGI